MRPTRPRIRPVRLLAEPADDPVNVLERGQRGRRSGGVGALAVVDIGNAGDFRDALHAVRQAGIALERGDLRGGCPGYRRLRCRCGIFAVVRTLQRRPLGLLARRDAPVLQDILENACDRTFGELPQYPRIGELGDRVLAACLHCQQARLAGSVFGEIAVIAVDTVVMLSSTATSQAMNRSGRSGSSTVRAHKPRLRAAAPARGSAGRYCPPWWPARPPL